MVYVVLDQQRRLVQVAGRLALGLDVLPDESHLLLGQSRCARDVRGGHVVFEAI